MEEVLGEPDPKLVDEVKALDFNFSDVVHYALTILRARGVDELIKSATDKQLLSALMQCLPEGYENTLWWSLIKNREIPGFIAELISEISS
jgi:hypothetical protein